MNREWEPEFLTREIVDAIHEEQINAFGGIHGVRDENSLESAIMAAQNVYLYGEGVGMKSARRTLIILLKAKLIWMATSAPAPRLLSCSWKDAACRAVDYLSSRLMNP